MSTDLNQGSRATRQIKCYVSPKDYAEIESFQPVNDHLVYAVRYALFEDRDGEPIWSRRAFRHPLDAARFAERVRGCNGLATDPVEVER